MKYNENAVLINSFNFCVSDVFYAYQLGENKEGTMVHALINTIYEVQKG